MVAQTEWTDWSEIVSCGWLWSLPTTVCTTLSISGALDCCLYFTPIPTGYCPTPILSDTKLCPDWLDASCTHYCIGLLIPRRLLSHPYVWRRVNVEPVLQTVKGGTGVIIIVQFYTLSTFHPPSRKGQWDLFRLLHAVMYGTEALVYSNHPREAAASPCLAIIFRRIASGENPGSSVQQRC